MTRDEGLRALLASMNEWLGNEDGLMIEDVVEWRDRLAAALAASSVESPVLAADTHWPTERVEEFFDAVQQRTNNEGSVTRDEALRALLAEADDCQLVWACRADFLQWFSRLRLAASSVESRSVVGDERPTRAELIEALKKYSSHDVDMCCVDSEACTCGLDDILGRCEDAVDEVDAALATSPIETPADRCDKWLEHLRCIREDGHEGGHHYNSSVDNLTALPSVRAPLDPALLDESQPWFLNLLAARDFVAANGSRKTRHHIIGGIDEAIRHLRAALRAQGGASRD